MSNKAQTEVLPQKVKASDHDIYGVTTIVSLLIPIVGVILGIIYLSKTTKVDRKLGEHLVAIGILSFIVYGILWTIWGSGLVGRSIDTNPTYTQTTTPATPTWDIDSQYAKITNGMAKSDVEIAIGRTTTDCSKTQQSGSSDVYASCSYGGVSDGGIIVVNYINDKVSSKNESTY